MSGYGRNSDWGRGECPKCGEVYCDSNSMPYKDTRLHICRITNRHSRNAEANLGWICPKCGYVWAQHVDGCSNCNRPKLCTGTSVNVKGEE